MRTLIPIRPTRLGDEPLSCPPGNFFDRLFAWNDERLGDWAPDMDLIEKPEAFFVNVEVPGMDPEDIHVTLEGRELTIKGERASDEVAEEDNLRIRERSFGSFLRTFTFSVPVDENGIEAKVENGLLTVEIKKARKAEPTRIEVKTH